MRQMITKSLELICQIAIVVMLLGGLISGWQMGGFFGAIGGLIGAFIFSVGNPAFFATSTTLSIIFLCPA